MTKSNEDILHSVLVIDDSASTRGLIKSSLEGAGFEVFEACTGFQAIKELQVRSYSLIITDINMPDLTGLEIIKFARSSPAHKQTPLLVISTEKKNRDKNRALALGADRYMVKPFDLKDLVQISQGLINHEQTSPTVPRNK